MKATVKDIQTQLRAIGFNGVNVDNVLGPVTRAAILQALKKLPPVASPALPNVIHSVYASSFADPADIVAFKKCKAQDKSDQACFKVGDNGIGKWGDSTTGTRPMCALPREDWANVANPRLKPVVVTIAGKSVTCLLGDTMPARANIKNGCGIDLNYAACKAFGLKPPIKVKATWRWA